MQLYLESSVFTSYQTESKAFPTVRKEGKKKLFIKIPSEIKPPSILHLAFTSTIYLCVEQIWMVDPPFCCTTSRGVAMASKTETANIPEAHDRR